VHERLVFGGQIVGCGADVAGRGAGARGDPPGSQRAPSCGLHVASSLQIKWAEKCPDSR